MIKMLYENLNGAINLSVIIWNVGINFFSLSIKINNNYSIYSKTWILQCLVVSKCFHNILLYFHLHYKSKYSNEKQVATHINTRTNDKQW